MNEPSEKFDKVKNADNEDKTHDESIITLDDQLESIGFELVNGKPRFRLNEPAVHPMVQLNTSLANFTIPEDDKSLSFVVLDKESLQTSTLASYTEIQQKCDSIDYNSVVSSMNTSEIQQKVTELLQENAKLKETLRQNNSALKQQFNSLATCLEDVTKVHQNHKKKFAETRELVNQLRNENMELKTRFITKQNQNAEDENKKSLSKNLNENSENESNTILILSLQDKIAALTEELKESNLTCSKLKEECENHERIISTMCGQIRGANALAVNQSRKVERLISESMQKSQINVESGQNRADNDSRDQEIAQLKETISQLENKLQYTFTPIVISAEPSCKTEITKERQYFVNNAKIYDENLKELTNCYIEQISRYSNIQACLEDCINLFESLEMATSSLNTEKTDNSWSLLNDGVQNHKEKLSNHFQKFREEHLLIIEDKQKIIKAQKQFQKILSDYHSVLFEMEIILEENVKLNTIRKNAEREMQERISVFEKQTVENMTAALEEEKQQLKNNYEVFMQEKQLLDKTLKNLMTEKNSLEIIRSSLEEEKKTVLNHKSKLEEELNTLSNQKELLRMELDNLNAEKFSLDKQSQLYDAQERYLQEERRTLEKKNEKTLQQLNTTMEQLKKQQEIIKDVRQKLTQKEEHNQLLTSQLSVYQEDYKQERDIKNSLMCEKDMLNQKMEDLIKRNESLSMEIRRLNGGNPESEQSNRVLMDGLITSYRCPNCYESFLGLQNLELHVERCLNLH